MLSQFIDPDGEIAAQVFVLGVTSVAIELIVLFGYGAGAGRLHALAASPRVVRLADRAGGVLLVTAGIGLATGRRP